MNLETKLTVIGCFAAIITMAAFTDWVTAAGLAFVLSLVVLTERPSR